MFKITTVYTGIKAQAQASICMNNSAQWCKELLLELKSKASSLKEI